MEKSSATLPEQDREQIREIVLKGLRSMGLEGPCVRVFLFGSQLKGNAHMGSDVDVAVLSARPLPTGTLSLVREHLEDSTVPQVVEVVDLGQTDVAFRNAVMREGQEWTV